MASNRAVTLAGTTVEYEVCRSGDATEPRIDVDIHGIQVVLPESSEADPTELLGANATWVLDKQSTYDRYREQAPDRTFEPGAEFPYLGDDHEIVVEPRARHAVTDGEIRLRQSAVDQSSVRRVLANCYRSNAREYLTDRIDHFAAEMDVAYDRIQLRNQRTRWGSCSTNGTLSLNWRLIMSPPAVIDYVVVHELAHLLVADHSREFWRVVGEQLPEYKQHAEWLDEHSVELIFSEDDL